MSRLIYAEELKTALISCRDLGRRSCEAVAKVIDEQPTIEAVPVVHGEWKYYKKQGIAVCTNCSFERKLDNDFGKAITCPNCGADMRKGGENQ